MKIFDRLHSFLWLDPNTNNCNTFLIDQGKRILIDPGHYQLFGHVYDGLSRLSLTLEDIDLVIITHGHPDHMEAVGRFSGASSSMAVSSIEMDFIRTLPPHLAAALGVRDFEPDILLHEGSLNVGDICLQVIYTPGHSPGSVCVYWPETKALFAGDVVFNQGVGRTDLPGGEGQRLKDSINLISQLDVEYLLTGHGDIVVGRDAVKANFDEIKRVWFAYI